MSIQSGFGAAKVAVEENQKAQAENIKFERLSIKQDEAPKTVRFLVLDGDDSVITFTEHWTEFHNGWKRNFVCPNDQLGQDNCLVCRGPKSIYVTDQRKPAHMIQVIDREDGKVKVWKFSPMAMAGLLEHLNNLGNISDRDYTIQFVKNEDGNKNDGIKTKFYYIIEPVSDKPQKATAADAQLAAGRYTLADLIPKYDEENLEKISKMTKEESQKGAAKPNPDDLAKDFLSKVGKGANLVADFASILPKKSAEPAAAEAVEPEAVVAETSGDVANAEFLAVLEQMNK